MIVAEVVRLRLCDYINVGHILCSYVIVLVLVLDLEHRIRQNVVLVLSSTGFKKFSLFNGFDRDILLGLFGLFLSFNVTF